ncbi:MAG: peptidase Ste24p [Bryobacterales bacterium]|nr:peptidase Ste24p [Bryobacterales bacterium]
MKRLLLLSTLIATSAVAARKPGSPLRPALLNLFSKQQDIQMGIEAANQVKQEKQVVPNAFLQSYVSKVGGRVAGTREATASGFPFSFTLVADPSINAFALPGGPMFIHSGLIAAVDNEAQLAGVMGHELAHVILRHGTHQASKATGISLIAGLAGAAAGNNSIMGQLAQAGIGLGANSVLLSFSREAETEADALGAHLMAEAGYDPKEMARFFAKLNEQGGRSGPQFLSDHPNPVNRETAIDEEVRTLPVRSYGFNTGDFARAKAEVAKLPKVAPKAAAVNGAATTNAPAGPPDTSVSNGLRTLRGQGYSLQYPDNWQVYGENTATVTLAPANGMVQRGVGLGAVISFYKPQNNNGVDLNRDTQALIAQLRSGDPAMKIAASPVRIRVDNRDALQTQLNGNSPYGGVEQDALVTVATDQGLFYLVFVVPQAQASKLEPTLGRIVRSIRLTQ